MGCFLISTIRQVEFSGVASWLSRPAREARGYGDSRINHLCKLREWIKTQSDNNFRLQYNGDI